MPGTLTTLDSTSFAAPGVTGSYEGNSLALKAIIVLSAGLSIFNALEVLILIFSTFSCYRTLYFWSLFASSLSIIPYALGYCFKFFGTFLDDAKWTSLTLLTIGWYVMVTGQAAVLWSRLHLIVTGDCGSKILLYTKWMIIINIFLLHIPTTVVTFGSNGSLNTPQFVKAYDVVEKYQMTGFFIQETILSSIYIVETVKMLRASLQINSRQLMQLLVFINIAIIIMDLALLCVEYASLFLLQTVLKGLCYSIKLKLEFAILSRLVNFVHSGQRGASDNVYLTNGGLGDPQLSHTYQQRSPELDFGQEQPQNLDNVRQNKLTGNFHGSVQSQERRA